jgi:hypothetical protein
MHSTSTQHRAWRPLLLASALLLALAVGLSWRLGSSASLDYDEGVYLVSARLLLHGHRLFAEVFSSQPPLFLDLLHGAFRAFGDSVSTGRSLSVVAALVTCVAVGYLAGTRVTPWAAPWAIFLCGGSIVFLRQARAVQAEMPALALATAALSVMAAGERGRDRCRQAAAGALMGLALAGKLLVAPGIVPLLLGAVDGRRQRLTGSIPSMTVAVGAMAAAFLAVCAPHGLAPVYQQSVTFHLAARALSSDLVGAAWRRVFVWDGALMAAAAIGMTALAVRRAAAFPWLLAWLGSTAAFLALHAPLMVHHLVLAIPPLAVGATGILALAGRRLLPLGLLALAGFVKRDEQGRPRLAPTVWAEQASHGPSDDEERAIAALRDWTRPDELVVTDSQMLAYLADRDVPPELCDTSVVRIASGSLGPSVARAETRRARAVLLWSGRLQLLPGYVEWLQTGGTQVQSFVGSPSTRRVLYVMGSPRDPVPTRPTKDRPSSIETPPP